jgi:hypothetical protein
MITRSFIPINSLVCSACVVYYGPFLIEYRTELLQEWHAAIQEKELSLDDQSALIKFLCDDIRIQRWNL